MRDVALASGPQQRSLIAELFVRAQDPWSSLTRLKEAYRKLSNGAREPVVLFGSGAWGRYTARRLAKAGLKVSAFADNASHPPGTTVEDIPVRSPKEAVELLGRDALFVTTIYNGSAARKQLAALGCTRVLSAISFYYGLSDLFIPYYQLDHPRVAFEARRTIEAAASSWDDACSRRVFTSRLSAMLGLSPDADEPIGRPQDCYFDPELLTIGRDERVVDCGAFDGDTIRRLLTRTADGPTRIVALEPDPANACALRRFVAGFDPVLRDRIEVIEAAASRVAGEIAFAASGTVAAQVGSGPARVRTIALDDLAESVHPTYVKMDIEGHELDALEGAVTLMKRAPPLLAISLYHRADDLWRIPVLIQQANPRYRLFLRCYAEDGWESVCYAIPEGRTLPVIAS